MRRHRSGFIKASVVSAAALILPSRTFAGSAEAAPGAHRPDWVIWAALATLMLVLLGVIIAVQWPGRPKGGSKTGLPYL